MSYSMTIGGTIVMMTSIYKRVFFYKRQLQMNTGSSKMDSNSKNFCSFVSCNNVNKAPGPRIYPEPVHYLEPEGTKEKKPFGLNMLFDEDDKCSLVDSDSDVDESPCDEVKECKVELDTAGDMDEDDERVYRDCECEEEDIDAFDRCPCEVAAGMPKCFFEQDEFRAMMYGSR